MNDDASYACPICGCSTPHEHPEETAKLLKAHKERCRARIGATRQILYTGAWCAENPNVASGLIEGYRASNERLERELMEAKAAYHEVLDGYKDYAAAYERMKIGYRRILDPNNTLTPWIIATRILETL